LFLFVVRPVCGVVGLNRFYARTECCLVVRDVEAVEEGSYRHATLALGVTDGYWATGKKLGVQVIDLVIK